jgi:hypothetical protein
MNEQEICKEIANLHDNILAAGVIENQRLVARYSKVDVLPHPDEERIRLMFAQPEVLLSICKTTEDYFVTVHYLIICFENSDQIFFPHSADGESRIFYVRTKRNFRGEEIIQKVYDYLEHRAKGQTEA